MSLNNGGAPIKVFVELNEIEILGNRTRISPTKAELLAVLLKYEGKIVRMQKIINTIWGPHRSYRSMVEAPEKRALGAWPNSLYVHICQLRKIIDDVATIVPARFDGGGCHGSNSSADGYRLTFISPAADIKVKP